MPKKRWWRNVSLAFVLATAAVTAALYFTMPGWNSVQGGAVVLVGMIGVIALCCVLIAQREHRRDAALRAGETGSVRWTVPPVQWSAFVANERHAAKADGVLFNKVDIDQPVPAAGIEVIIGSGAIVGNEYHSLYGATGPFCVDSTPPTLAYHVSERDPDDSYVDRAIRFPVAAGAEDAARALAASA